MLRHRRNDGDVDLGVTGIPKRVEATTPRGNDASTGGNDQGQESNSKGTAGEEPEEGLVLTAGDGRTDIVQKGEELEEAKDS